MWFYGSGFLFGLYLRCTCSVPTPYFLRSEVPLSGECTEQVWFGYGFGKKLIEANYAIGLLPNSLGSTLTDFFYFLVEYCSSSFVHKRTFAIELITIIDMLGKQRKIENLLLGSFLSVALFMSCTEKDASVEVSILSRPNTTVVNSNY